MWTRSCRTLALRPPIFCIRPLRRSVVTERVGLRRGSGAWICRSARRLLDTTQRVRALGLMDTPLADAAGGGSREVALADLQLLAELNGVQGGAYAAAAWAKVRAREHTAGRYEGVRGAGVD